MAAMKWLLLLFCASCAAPGLEGAIDAGYSLNAPVTTPGGVIYDGSAGGIPVLDRIVGEVAGCLARPLPALRVKVAPDWILNCDQTREELPGYATGTDPTKADWFHGPDCSAVAWHYQALYQEDGLVVTTPSFFDVKDPVVRLALGGMTAEDLWWRHPDLAACANPSTQPLDIY